MGIEGRAVEALILDSEGVEIWFGVIKFRHVIEYVVPKRIRLTMMTAESVASPLEAPYTICRAYLERERGDGVMIYRQREDFHG